MSEFFLLIIFLLIVTPGTTDLASSMKTNVALQVFKICNFLHTTHSVLFQILPQIPRQILKNKIGLASDIAKTSFQAQTQKEHLLSLSSLKLLITHSPTSDDNCCFPTHICAPPMHGQLSTKM